MCYEASVIWHCWQQNKFFIVGLPNHVQVAWDLSLKNHHRKKSGDVRSGDLAGHVMYGDPLLIHLAGNCSSKKVRTMVEPHLAGKMFHQGVEAQHTAATYPSTCLQWSFPQHIWFFSGGLLRTRSTGHHYVNWQNYKKEFILLSTMSHHRCLVTHGSRLNTGCTFPVPLMDNKSKFMEHKVKKIPFLLFVATGLINIFVLVQKL